MELSYVQDRIVVRVDMEKKNWHQFESGANIRIERKYDNFNRRHTEPVNAVVISGEGVVPGSEIIIHHNSTDASNLITNHGQLSGEDIASDIRYFSILESECFAWYDEAGEEWKPMKGFDFALRVFVPYKGQLHGIEPTLIKDCLYITTGEYKGLVCYTLKSCDYELIFQGRDGREKRLIRFRSTEDEKTQRECEIVCIANDLTNQVNNEDLFVGLTKSDCKPLNSYINDRRRTKQNDTIIAP